MKDKMYIYADETGHSGKNVFSSPLFYRQGAILSVGDIDPVVGPVLREAQSRTGEPEIHAAELARKLGSDCVAEIACSLLDALDASTKWTLHLTEIEKPYLVTTKFVDTVFDSAENRGARWLWYNTEYFRHVLCCLIDDMFVPANRRRFWRAYLSDDQGEIKTSIFDLQLNLGRVTGDPRATEVILDAFTFATNFPDEITLIASVKKESYKGHTPNMVAFSSLIQAVHSFAEDNRSAPRYFYHDEQNEFANTMAEYHQICSRFRLIQKQVLSPLSVEAKLAKYDLGRFSMPSSKSYPPLQAVDVLLWLVQRETDLSLQEIRDRILANTDRFSISRATSESIRAEGFDAIVNLPLNGEKIARGKLLASRLEEDHKRGLREFRQKQTDRPKI